MSENEFRKLTQEEVCDKLKAATHPIIVMHCRPDGDTLGSAVALAKIFGAMGKRAICICADKIPSRLEFMCDGYVFENYSITSSNTVITVDVAARNQLGGLAEGISPVLMIDHHASGTPFTDNFVVDTAAACGEIIFDIARTLTAKGIIGKIDESMADSLYAAISSDTGCFKYANTTPKTLRAAAKLLELGARGDEINHLLFDSKDIRQLKAEAIALENTEFFDNGHVAICTIPTKVREDAGIDSEFFESAIDVVRSVRGVEIAATIKENIRGEFKTSLRSLKTDVASVAAAFGGGGHVRASGCSIPAENMDEAKSKLLALLIPDDAVKTEDAPVPSENQTES